MAEAIATVGWMAFGLVELAIFIFIIALGQWIWWRPWVKGFQKVTASQFFKDSFEWHV